MPDSQPNATRSGIYTDMRCEQRITYRLLLSINGIEVPTANISVSGAQGCCPAMHYKSLMTNQDQSLSVNWLVPQSSIEVHCNASLRYANLCEDE